MKKRENVYVRPVTERIRLVTESGICSASGDETGKDTKTTIEKQGGQDWSTEFEWD